MSTTTNTANTATTANIANIANTDASTGLRIAKIGGRVGAEVTGIDLTQPVPTADADRIKAAVLEHKVVFFPGQEVLDEARLLTLGGELGDVTETAHPTSAGVGDYHQISRIDSEQWIAKHESSSRSGPNFWHTDATFVHRPPTGAILQAVILPPVGGDTAWANTAAAYESLPRPLKALADELWAVHSNRRGYADPRSSSELPPLPGADKPRSTDLSFAPLYESLHPVVQVHPETGERALLLGAHLRHLLGLDGKVAAEVLDALQYHVERLENVVRWHWSVGDVAIFDNRTTQHYAVSDYDGQRRLVQRVSFRGAPPQAIDGRHSVPRVGDVTAPEAVDRLIEEARAAASTAVPAAPS